MIHDTALSFVDARGGPLVRPFFTTDLVTADRQGVSLLRHMRRFIVTAGLSRKIPSQE